MRKCKIHTGILPEFEASGELSAFGGRAPLRVAGGRVVQGVGALCGDSAVLGWMRGTVTVTECVDEAVCARCRGLRAF